MVDSLSDMVLRGQAIQVHLEPLDQLETLLAAVQEWKESAAAAFLQKDLTKNLLEVSPSLKWKSQIPPYGFLFQCKTNCLCKNIRFVKKKNSFTGKSLFKMVKQWVGTLKNTSLYFSLNISNC